MKSVIISIVLMCVVIWGSIRYNESLISVSDELSNLNYGIRDSLEKGNADGAADVIEQMSAYLDKKESILSVMGNHEDIDKIRINIAELKRYTGGRNITDALSKSEILEFLFGHLPENYTFKLKNVL